jgi:hypothetical protein
MARAIDRSSFRLNAGEHSIAKENRIQSQRLAESRQLELGFKGIAFRGRPDGWPKTNFWNYLAEDHLYSGSIWVDPPSVGTQNLPRAFTELRRGWVRRSSVRGDFSVIVMVT